MKRILRWLKAKLPRFRSLDLPNASDESGTIHSTDVELRIKAPNVIQEPTKNVPTPFIDADEHVATVPNLELLDESPTDADTSIGFNPYDTATLQVK